MKTQKKQMKVEISKQQVNLALQLQFPLSTLRVITSFLEDRNVIVDSLLMINNVSNSTVLFLQFFIEKEAMSSCIEQLISIPGITRLDEDKGQITKESIIRVLRPDLNK